MTKLIIGYSQPDVHSEENDKDQDQDNSPSQVMATAEQQLFKDNAKLIISAVNKNLTTYWDDELASEDSQAILPFLYELKRLFAAAEQRNIEQKDILMIKTYDICNLDDLHLSKEKMAILTEVRQLNIIELEQKYIEQKQINAELDKQYTEQKQLCKGDKQALDLLRENYLKQKQQLGVLVAYGIIQDLKLLNQQASVNSTTLIKKNIKEKNFVKEKLVQALQSFSYKSELKSFFDEYPKIYAFLLQDLSSQDAVIKKISRIDKEIKQKEIDAEELMSKERASENYYKLMQDANAVLKGNDEIVFRQDEKSSWTNSM